MAGEPPPDVRRALEAVQRFVAVMERVRVSAEAIRNMGLVPELRLEPIEYEEVRDLGGRPRGIVVPTLLAEEAVLAHVHEGLGRRPLELRFPGLGEWGARVIIFWYDTVGKPAGLWLDGDERLCWGPAITPIWDPEQGVGAGAKGFAPTPPSLSLPRP